jgi:putative spermidine/putrescine transport system ATP-binding protein
VADPVPATGRQGARPLALENLSKVFGTGQPAVDRVSMRIEAGEFFSLLGPSGCGKTTTLRMVAGFEAPDAGRILLGGEDITALPPERRDMGMVFQNYALFPHRTIAENVAFGLRMRKVPKAEIAARVREALALVRLTGFEDRRPAQLSGGQQQRVALARAIVINPTVLLCDEPLGALDKKLRQQMQFELKTLHRRLGLTMIYVTHDQEEALTMSDRIAVMRAGKVAQSGPPQEIYDRPVDRFVADFIGDTNILEGEAQGMALAMPGWTLPLAAPATGRVAVALRPERVRVAPPGQGLVDATVEEANFLGDAVLLKLALPGEVAMLARSPRQDGAALAEPGARVSLSWQAEDPVVLADG